VRTEEHPPPGVLIVVQNLSVPTDRRVWSEAQALVAAGYTVSVICPRGDGDPPYRLLDGVHIHTYPPAPPAAGFAGYAWEFAYSWLRTAGLSLRVLRRHGFDAMQACNPPDTYWALGRLYRPLGKRFIYDQHDLCPEVFRVRFGRNRGAVHRALLWLERRTYRTADHVISTNESYRDVALSRGGVDPADVTIVRSAPDPEVMRRGAPDLSLKKGRRYLAAYLGIMGPQDGVDGLLRAVDEYVHHLGRDDCSFALLGFGDCEDELRRQCTALGLDDWVTFTGRADATMISRYLSTADVGITPDPKNCFNDVSTMNKTLEYMSFQLPVLASDLLETRRSTAGSAVFVGETDDQAFARALGGLLDDQQLRQRLGEAGRRRIVTHLSWAEQAKAYVGVYDRLLGRRPSRHLEGAAPVGLPAPSGVGASVPYPEDRNEGGRMPLGVPAQRNAPVEIAPGKETR
jgi:glycosyltransferase involved in cell wall biosynthesis